MSQVKISGNASGTGILTVAAPNTNTDYTLTLPAETGTVLTSASSITQNAGPTFSAYLSSGQTISNATHTKIQYNTEEWDTNNNYDNATNYRFTPTVAGYYQINAGFRCDTGSAEAFLYLYKNGSGYRTFIDIQPTAQYGLSGSTLVYANGSTDYFEVYFWHNAGTSKTSSSGASFPFQASLVRAA